MNSFIICSQQLRNPSCATSPIIQKINKEIEELHRREKELMSRSKSISSAPLGSTATQHEDEDDVFSSNGSSVDEFEHSESPRLESGFYSNVGEDEAQLMGSPDLLKATESEVESPESAIKVNSSVPRIWIGEEEEKVPLALSPSLSLSLNSFKGSKGSLHSPLEVTEQTHSPTISESTFNFS